MLQKGDYVNYRTWGICRIDGMKFMQPDSNRNGGYYFVLSPVFQKNSTVYVPADSAPLNGMRPILSPEQIDDIISSVKGRQLPWIADRKQRLAHFQKILYNRDEGDLILLVSRMRMKAADGALTGADVKIMKEAQSIIEQEFSFALKLNADDIGEYIRRRLQEPCRQDAGA